MRIASVLFMGLLSVVVTLCRPALATATPTTVGPTTTTTTTTTPAPSTTTTKTTPAPSTTTVAPTPEQPDVVPVGGRCSAAAGFVPAAVKDTLFTGDFPKVDGVTLEGCCAKCPDDGVACVFRELRAANTTQCFILVSVPDQLLVKYDTFPGEIITTLNRQPSAPRSTTDIIVGALTGMYALIGITAAIVAIASSPRDDVDRSRSNGSRRGGGVAPSGLSDPLLGGGPVPPSLSTSHTGARHEAQRNRGFPTGLDDGGIAGGALDAPFAGVTPPALDGGESLMQTPMVDRDLREAHAADLSDDDDDDDSDSVGIRRQAAAGSASGLYGTTSDSDGIPTGDAAHPLFDKRTGAEYARKYRFLKKLGEGVSSQVYLVRARGQRRATPVAMKVMECATDDDMQSAFTEYMSMKRLQGHPHVVELIDMSMMTEQLPKSVTRLPRRSLSAVSNLDSSDNGEGAAESGSRDGSRGPTPVAGSFGSTPSKESNGGGSRRFGQSSADSSRSASPIGHHHHHQSPTVPARTAFTCLLMRYYPEGTLEQGIKRDPAFFRRPAVIASYLRQLLSALSHSQQHNIAHFDLKPGNILLLESRHSLVVSDFGLSRTMTHDHTADEASEIGGGTLYYQAPEQLERRSVLRSDVWGAACTVVAMLTSRVGTETVPVFYWRAEHDFELTFRRRVQEARLPKALCDLLLDMLTVSVRERPRMDECFVRVSRLVPETVSIDTSDDEVIRLVDAAAIEEEE